MGDIKNPNDIFLVDCIPLQSSMTSGITNLILIETLKKYVIPDGNFKLLISDCASYMVKSGLELKTSG
jgi:hypothetical protein